MNKQFIHHLKKLCYKKNILMKPTIFFLWFSFGISLLTTLQNDKIPVNFQLQIEKYNPEKHQKTAKKLVCKSLRKFDKQPLFYAIDFSKSVDYKIIPSMIISKEGQHYIFKDNILKYLKFNKKTKIETALIFKAGEYIGKLDCVSNILSNNDNQHHPCGFDDAIEYQQQYIEGWKIIKHQQPEFIFAVKYIRNCWWFIKNNQAYILNLKNLKISPANQFLQEKCTEENIRNFAIGKDIYFCQ